VVAGYSKKPLLEKLGVKAHNKALIVSFATSRQQLESQFPFLTEAVYPDGALWIAWPKGESGIPTDLIENVVREVGLKNGVVDVKVAAIDKVWSGLKFVFRLEDRKQATAKSAGHRSTKRAKR
jgi:hypothetical protein